MRRRDSVNGLRVFGILAASLLASVLPAAAVDDPSRRNDNAPVQLAELAYLIGEWEVTSYSRSDGGEFEASEVPSFMEAGYLFDGYGVQVEFHSNDPDNFYSLSILTWDEMTGHFTMSFHNAKKNRRLLFEAEKRDGALLVTNRGGYAQQGDFLFRESDVEITDNSFVKRLHRSDDDGATWKELNYYFAFRRIGAVPGDGTSGDPGRPDGAAGEATDERGAGGDPLAGTFGQASAQAPPEVAQLMFLRGEWDVTIRTRDAEGAWQDTPAKPRVRGFYLEDGRTFQTTFSMGGGKVFFSTQVKAYDVEKKAWINTFTNSTRQRWATTESHWVDGELITVVPGGYGGDEPFTSREVLTEIRDGHYLMKLFRSTDDGANWVEQPMVLVFDRVNGG